VKRLPPLACGRWEAGALVLPVRVQPRARRLALGPVIDNRIKLALTAPPVDGKANHQARAALAEAFGVSMSRVILVQGESSRDKLFRIVEPACLPALIVRP
jgi:uncharacterized protein (TIGR00251 family)